MSNYNESNNNGQMHKTRGHRVLTITLQGAYNSHEAIVLWAGYRRRAQPQDGAVESAPPNTRTLDRTFRKTPSTGPLQDRESSINQPRGTGLFANLQNT